MDQNRKAELHSKGWELSQQFQDWAFEGKPREWGQDWKAALNVHDRIPNSMDSSWTVCARECDRALKTVKVPELQGWINKMRTLAVEWSEFFHGRGMDAKYQAA